MFLHQTKYCLGIDSRPPDPVTASLPQSVRKPRYIRYLQIPQKPHTKGLCFHLLIRMKKIPQGFVLSHSQPLSRSPHTTHADRPRQHFRRDPQGLRENHTGIRPKAPKLLDNDQFILLLMEWNNHYRIGPGRTLPGCIQPGFIRAGPVPIPGANQVQMGIIRYFFFFINVHKNLLISNNKHKAH